MKGLKRRMRWHVMMNLCLLVGLLNGGYAIAADSAVLDQEQASGSGNVWVNHEKPRFQTFTPALTGNLSRIDLNIFDSSGSTGSLQINLYKEDDLSTPIAAAQLASYGNGWVPVDFSGASAYLKKDKLYRMVVSTELGGNGFGWYLSSSDVYSRGYAAFGRDFTFRTYMIPDYSLSPAMSEVASADTSLVANGTSQTDITVKLKDAQGNAWPTGGANVVLTTTAGTLGPVTDNQNGTYTAMLTAPTTVGTATVTASVEGSAVASKATVQFVPGAPSTVKSTIEAGSATLSADGTSQTAVTVKLKDAQGNALTTGGANVVLSTTAGTLSSVTDNQNGTYTAKLTAPTTVGTATIGASVGGSALTSTATVQFVPGAPSSVKSTVEVDHDTLVADGTSQTAVTLKLKDAQGNVLTTGGAAVAMTSTLGTLSPVKDNLNGTYTAKLTAPTAVGTATINASVGGSAIASTAIVQFVPGAPSHVNSMVEADHGTLVADGTSQTTVTVKLKDAQGNVLTTGGAAVAVTSTLGTLSPVKDNLNGTYTAKLTAPTTVGIATISASVGGSGIASKATVQIVPGAPSTVKSTIEAGSVTLSADGTSQTAVTVKLKDAQGHALTAGGASVVMTSTLGTLGSVTDNNNGTYTAKLTAPITVGIATISASVGGSALATTATVQFVPGAPSSANSTLEVDSDTLTADGTSQTAVTVKLKDAQGHPLTTGGAAVVMATTLGTLSAVTDHQDGTYTAKLTAPTTVGTATISATVGGSAIASTATVQFVPGAPSSVNSTLEVGSDTLVADGTSQTEVIVKLKDAQGHPLTTGGANVAITSTLGTLSAVTDHQDGTYTAKLTAQTTVGTATISASVGGIATASKTTVQFLVGEVSSSHSTVIASDLVVRADGNSKATIVVKLKDEFDHPIAGKRVLLQANGGRSVIQDVYGPTDEDGQATFTVSNIAAENVTYSAKEESSGRMVDQTVNVTFTYNQPPSIELVADPIVPTFGRVTVSVTASVYGEFNSVSSIKWAAGSRPISYFDAEGVPITDHFTVQENGIYSVYAIDEAGNANVRLIEVQNIVPLSSNANLSGWQLTGLGGDIKFNFDPGAIKYTVEVGHSVNGLKMLMTTADAYSAIDVNGLQVSSNALTNEFPLVTGKNTFEVRVKAQDGTIKIYSLNVIRSTAISVPGSTSPSGDTSPASNPSPSHTIKAWINDKEMSGIAALRTLPNGVKSIEVLLDLNTLKKILAVQNITTGSDLSVSIVDEASQVTLRLPGDVVKLLADKSAAITLKTQHGQYRLPLAELMNQESDWTNDAEAQITIEHHDGEVLPGLMDSANKGGYQLVGDPLHFNIYVMQHGKQREVSSFQRYVERVIFLPKDGASKASTAVVWDQKQGVRLVPTKFTEIDGRPAAVIHSLTNSIYTLVSKTSQLADMQGHWAASEIADMNRRMIVQGLDGGRFAPEAAITRAELAGLLARALGLPQDKKSTDFRDVSESSWYSSSVSAVKAYGIMDGFQDGTFGPNREVSRQEAIVTLVRALQLADLSFAAKHAGVQVDLSVYTDRDQIGDWANDAMQVAIQESLLKGYGAELRPQQSLTRAETSVLLYRMLLQAGWINGKHS